MIATVAQIEDGKKQDFARLIVLMDEHSSAANQLKLLEATLNEKVQGIASDNREEYAALQHTLTATETEMEQIAKNHPDWFTEKRSIKTPFGTVKLTRSTKLEVKNEEATLAKIELMSERNKEFKKELYVRSRPELNLEALENLDDATLKTLGINRVEDENFSVKPISLDMGKAVKEVEAKEKKGKTA